MALPALREPSNVRGRGSKSAGEKLYPSLPSWTSGEGQSALASGQALASQYFRPTVDEGGCFMGLPNSRINIRIVKHIVSMNITNIADRLTEVRCAAF